MKKWIKASSLFLLIMFFCTGISFAGSMFDQGSSPLIVYNAGHGPGNGDGNDGDGPADGSGYGAPDGAGDCPSD